MSRYKIMLLSMSFFLLVSYLLDFVLFAGVINGYIFPLVYIFCLALFFILRKFQLRKGLIAIIILQIVLTGIFFPKYSYYDAENAMARLFPEATVDTLKSKAIEAPHALFQSVYSDYLIEVSQKGIITKYRVNPNDLNDYEPLP